MLRATEPMARAFAGRRWFPLWAVVHHRGRKSGTAYDTPVAVVPTTSADVILIGLPWGPKTNWARNIVAAGGAPITWKGRMQQTTAPRIVGGRRGRRVGEAVLPPDRPALSGRHRADQGVGPTCTRVPG